MFKSCVSLGTIFSCGFILINCTCEAGEYFNQTVTKFSRPGWPEYQLGGDRNNRIDQSASKETNKTITRKRSFSSYILSRSERASEQVLSILLNKTSTKYDFSWTHTQHQTQRTPIYWSVSILVHRLCFQANWKPHVEKTQPCWLPARSINPRRLSHYDGSK